MLGRWKVFFNIRTYRSPVKEWQGSWCVLGTITWKGTDTVLCKHCWTVRTKRLHISIKSFYCYVCAIQSYCPQSKPADLPLFYWRPVHSCGALSEPAVVPSVLYAPYPEYMTCPFRKKYRPFLAFWRPCAVESAPCLICRPHLSKNPGSATDLYIQVNVKLAYIRWPALIFITLA